MFTQIWSATDIIFCHFRSIFALLPHYWPQQSKFGKNVKNNWRYYPFIHVHHKSRSYDVWFLRYKVQRTKFFWHYGPFFCPFTLLTTKKKQNFEKIKHLETLSFYTCVPQMTIISCLVPKISSVTDRIFSILCYFLPFYPLTIQKIKILKKWKKFLEILPFYTIAILPLPLEIVPWIKIIWCMIPEIWSTKEFFFLILDHFLPF